MLEHPGKLLAEYLSKNWYTQKSFSVKVGKKVSEINELIKGKRNITVAWDIILCKHLATAPKFWIQKQIDYEYEQALSSTNDEDINRQIETGVDKKDSYVKQQENPFEERSLEDIIEEENRQNQYLKENIFKETPLEKKIEKSEREDKKIGKPRKQTKNTNIKDLLREDPIPQEGNNSLKQVFESF